MKTLTHKGYSRFYLYDSTKEQEVREIIKEIDEFEYGYMPKDWITSFDNYPQVIYHGKFSDMDMVQLQATCWDRGIQCWVFDSGRTDYPYNLIGGETK